MYCHCLTSAAVERVVFFNKHVKVQISFECPDISAYIVRIAYWSLRLIVAVYFVVKVAS